MVIFTNRYLIHTQHDCSSQMNENLLISVVKFTRFDREFAVANQQILVHL